jgi:hypothetical protein
MIVIHNGGVSISETLTLADGRLIPNLAVMERLYSRDPPLHFWRSENCDAARHLVRHILHLPPIKERVLISHNGGRFDSFLILSALVEEGVKTSVMASNQKIIQLCHKKDGCKTRWIDSFSWIPVSLREAATAFQLETRKGRFPISLLTEEFEGKTIPFPPLSYFELDQLKQKDRIEIEQWHESSKKANNVLWNWDEMLLNYCRVCNVCVLRSLTAFNGGT